MKHLSTYAIIFCLGIFYAKSQNNHGASINPVDRVPLIVESQGLMDSVFSIDGKTSSFQTVSSDLKVRVMLPLQDLVVSKAYYIKLPYALPSLKVMEFRYFVNKLKSPNSWQDLGKAIDQPLIDIKLAAGDKLFLQFRSKSTDEIVQQDIFIRQAILPSVVTYRSKRNLGQSERVLNAKAVQRKIALFDDFKLPTNGIFIVEPGWSFETIIKGPKMINDSSLQFRVLDTETDTASSWIPTGRYLSIIDFAPNKDYILQVRFAGLEDIISCNITSLPYWYQTKLFMWLSLLLAFLVAGVIPWVIYRQRLKREKTRRNLIENQLNSIQSKLNPHFIYNALESIQNLIRKNNVQDASDYVNRFSDLMRNTLENSDKLYIPLSEEIKLLKNYLSIEQLRFGFAFEISIDPHLDTYSIDFPPMLLQPSVENAVKHGAWKLAEAGSIKMDFQGTENGFNITIRNHRQQGSGIPELHQERFGIRLTKARVENLKKIFKSSTIDYQLEYTDTECIVTFSFENFN